MEPISLVSLLPLGTHQHLPAWHEVGTLADPLEDALKLGADEAVVLGDRETRNTGSSEEGGEGAPVGVPEVRDCW